MIKIYSEPPKGWECPKCGRVHAPFIPMCSFCPATTVTPVVMNTCAHEYEQLASGLVCRKCDSMLRVPPMATGS